MGEDRRRLAAAAMGKIPCDLTVKNVQYVNVFTGEIYPAEVDVIDGRVARVRCPGEPQELESGETVDGGGNYLIPGFIDAHVHVESSMMIPEQFGRAVVPWGTTAVCTDPHEIANVLGIDGVKFMLENGKKSLLRQYVLAPSCVPAVPGLENSGAEFGEKEIEEILDMDGVVGIAEIMDFVGVYNGSERMHAIIRKGLEKGTFLQGHAPLLTGKELSAYAASGIESDHESETGEEIREKLRRGMHINLRASSLVNHMDQLAAEIRQIPYHDFISICTDDVHAGDLLTLGHVNKVVRYGIEHGLDPVDVIRMATLNAAREYGFKDLGAVAPGYRADMQLVRALDGSRPKLVWIGGQLAAEQGVYVGEDAAPAMDFPNTVKAGWIRAAEDFSLIADKTENGTVPVNVIVPLDAGNVLRKTERQELMVRDHRVCLDGREDLAFVCVCNRHGLEKKTVAVIQNFGLREGAVGTTVSHDSHNAVIVYRKEEDALVLLRELERMGGGLCVVRDGQVTGSVALPAAGLMSPKSGRQVAEEFEGYRRAFYQVCGDDTPLLSCAIMSLTALPGIVVTDCGLVDGGKQEFVDVFAD